MDALYAYIYVLTLAFIAFGVFVLLRTKEAWLESENLPVHVAAYWWVLDAGWSLLIIISALRGLWLLPVKPIPAIVCGVTSLVAGLVLTLIGVLEFKSIKRMSGLDASRLITSGVYRWSRNPQFLGAYLSFLGISLAGRSGYALLLSAIAIAYCHYYIVKVEEPHLERVFGEEYRVYKSRVPRYFWRF